MTRPTCPLSRALDPRMAKLLAYACAVTFALLSLGGCTTISEVIPAPQAGDCYIAERAVNVDPAIGVGGVLDGYLVSRGCADLIRAITEAKREGIDINPRDVLP